MRGLEPSPKLTGSYKLHPFAAFLCSGERFVFGWQKAFGVVDFGVVPPAAQQEPLGTEVPRLSLKDSKDPPPAWKLPA